MLYHSWASSQVSFLWIEMDGSLPQFCAITALPILHAGHIVCQGFCDWTGAYISLLEACRGPSYSKGTRTKKGWRLCIGTSPTSSHSVSCITVILGNGTCRQFVEGNPLPLQQPGLFGEFHGTPLVNSSIEWSTAQLNVIQSWFWRTCFATGDVQLYLCHPIIRRLH